MIKAVVYDLDGTLVDTLTTIAYYANAALEAHGLCALQKDDYKYYVGNGAKKLVERMIVAANASPDEYYDSVFEMYNKMYDSAPTYLSAPYEGIVETVGKLHGMGIKQAVLSNKPDFAAKQVISENLGDIFERVYGAREGVKLKPEPDALLSLLAELEVGADETIYVGDTSVDMLAGKSAGAYTVGVLWGFRSEDELRTSGADSIISKPCELLDIISKL